MVEAALSEWAKERRALGPIEEHPVEDGPRVGRVAATVERLLGGAVDEERAGGAHGLSSRRLLWGVDIDEANPSEVLREL